MPKTYNNLWQDIYPFDSLYKAYLLARKGKKGKRFYRDVLEYGQNLEENIITTQNELIWKTWTPAPSRQFLVREPKKRLITAPAFKDRVVHHALVSVVEPLFEKKFIPHSFACRLGKGTHATGQSVLSTLQKRTSSWGQVWVLQTDISQYFASINHDILMSVLGRTIRDKNVLWLFNQIIRNSGFDGVGIPVGALTSQLCANIYLDQLDHYITDKLGISPYIRYMDDTLTFASSRSELCKIYQEIKNFVETRLSLKLNPKSRIYKASQGIDFCGYRTWSGYTLPRKRNVSRMRRRMKKLCKMYRRGVIPAENVRAAWASFMGYMKHCNGFRIKCFIWSELNRILRREVNDSDC